jgi:hypothetical protein
MIKMNEIRSNLKETGKQYLAVNKILFYSAALIIVNGVNKIKGNK